MSSDGRLWDLVRSCWVAATPEEVVRQNLLQKMMGDLGFPKALIAVEKDIASLPLPRRQDPHRRIDILAYALVRGKLQPLIVFECKAEKIDLIAKAQAFGYNNAIFAPFLCLAGKEEVATFWKEGEKVRSIPFLPSYKDLVQKL